MAGDDTRPPRALTIGAGVAADFLQRWRRTRLLPVMALYLQVSKVDKMRFLGTSAWFYFIVNVSKTPLTAALGLFTPRVLTTAAMMIPVVLLGTVIGVAVIGRT